MPTFIARIYIPSQITGNIYFQIALYAFIAYTAVAGIWDLYLQTRDAKWLKLSAKQKLLRILLAFKITLMAPILFQLISGFFSWWIIAVGAIYIFVGIPLMEKAEHRIEYQKYSECPSGKAYLLINHLVYAGWACTGYKQILETHRMNNSGIINAYWHRSGEFDGFNCQIDANYRLTPKENKDLSNPTGWDLSEQAEGKDCAITVVLSLLKSFEREVFDEDSLRQTIDIAYRKFFERKSGNG